MRVGSEFYGDGCEGGELGKCGDRVRKIEAFERDLQTAEVQEEGEVDEVDAVGERQMVNPRILSWLEQVVEISLSFSQRGLSSWIDLTVSISQLSDHRGIEAGREQVSCSWRRRR